VSTHDLSNFTEKIIFNCLYEIDYENPIDSCCSYKIKKVLSGNKMIEYLQKVDFFGNKFYLWKRKKSSAVHGAYYQAQPGFEILELENDEQAMLYYKLNY